MAFTKPLLLGLVLLAQSVRSDHAGPGVTDVVGAEPAGPSALMGAEQLDDECNAQDLTDGSGACALNALQLRGVKVTAAANQSEAFLDSLNHRTVSPPGSDDEVPAWSQASQVDPKLGCVRVTTGTCTIFGCHASRGETSCTEGQCLCKEGFCSNSYGICVEAGGKKCHADTDARCRFRNCPGALGKTTCSSDHRCQCEEGSCFVDFAGFCAKPDQCLKDTGGSCKLGFCYSNRGPAQCQEGRCICPDGYCAEDNGAGYGVCKLQRHPDYLAKVAAVNQDHPHFPKPHDSVNIGLSFSGGGARALSFALGAYRALEDLGLMKHVDAISSISGGTWASSIYMFSIMNKSELLGDPTTPSSLTLEYLANPQAKMSTAVTQSDAEFIRRTLLRDESALDTIWQQLIAELILKPFGLGSRRAFLAGSQEDVARIKRENPQLEDQVFYTPAPGRPKVFVMGGTILAPVGYESGPGSAVALQMSPDFTGSPFWPLGASARGLAYEPAQHGALGALPGVAVGGGMVETFAFGSKAPKNEGGQSGKVKANVDPPNDPFTLSDAVGISSIAPAGSLAASGKFQKVIPQAYIWPVLTGSEKQAAMEYTLGDGGNIENSGLLALLQRGARKAAMWVSTYIPLSTEIDFCNPASNVNLEDVFAGKSPDEGGFAVAPMVSDKFGYPFQDKGDFYTHNQVFAKEGLLPLLCELQRLRDAGKPTVVRKKYEVQPNSWWGIRGGHTVDLIISYLAQCKGFEAELPAETREALGPEETKDRTWKSSGEFARFPDYKTTKQTEQWNEIIRLTTSEVNLLAAQSEYFVRQNEALYREVLCPEGLAGRCCRSPTAFGCAWIGTTV